MSRLPYVLTSTGLALVALVPAAFAQRPGPLYLHFDGIDDYVSVPDHDDFSIPTTGELTVSAWMRPEVLCFPKEDGGGGDRYVNWLGKGMGVGSTSQQEWTFRMYGSNNTVNRENRISFYVFTPGVSLGVGSFFQERVSPGEWIHVTAVVDSQKVQIFKNGTFKRSDVYAGTITPANGTAPLRIGARDSGSFFQGGIAKVRIWNRALSAQEVQAVYASDQVPQNGLVAEYPLDRDPGTTVAPDSTGRHNGTINGAAYTIWTYSRPDFNGDLKVDLLFHNPTTRELALWYMNGNQWNGGAGFNALVAVGWQPSGVADFNCDGKPDLLFTNPTTRELALWFLNGTGYAGGASTNDLLPPGFQVAGLGQFDDDGRVDLLLQNPTTREIRVWYMDYRPTTNVFVHVSSATVNAQIAVDWKLVGTADFNGDGKPDFLFNNPTTRELSLWYMDGATYAGGASIPALVAQSWEFAQLGDSNGDGKVDLFFHNPTTRELSVWYMDGRFWNGGAGVPALVAVGWKLVDPR